MLIFFYFSNYKGTFRLFIYLILLYPLLQYGISITGSSVFERSFDTFLNNFGTTARAEYYYLAFNEFLNNPFFGGAIELKGIYPHNFILEILMATGFIGLTLFSFMLFNAFSKIKALINQNSYFLFVLLILVNGLIQHFFSSSIYVATLIFFPLAIILNSSIYKKYQK